MPNFRKFSILILFTSFGVGIFSQHWKSNISPLVGYRGIYNEAAYGGNIHMLELGAAYTTGTRDVNRFLFIPTSFGWRYFGPFVSLDAKFRSPEKLGSNAMMLNMGIIGGAGGFFSAILPNGLNGILSYSTDFKSSYLRMGLAYDLCFISLGGGVLSNLNGGQYSAAYDNQLYLEIRLLIWKNKGYRY
jgi:hypothetical protein